MKKRKELLRQHEIWGDFEDGKLTSKLHIIPFEVFIQGRTYPMGGIAGVATWPEYRRGGKVANLIKQSLISMRDKKQSVSFLHPFSIPFYRKYGWEIFTYRKKIIIENKHLHFLPQTNGRMKRVYLPEAINLLDPIYSAYANRFNGMLKRSIDWWETSVSSKGFSCVAYQGENGNYSGYLYYKVKDRQMNVEEMVYLNEEARRGIWNFICQHDSMVEKVSINTYAQDELPFLLHNPNVPQEITPYTMARIVDMKKFLDSYPIQALETPIILNIWDEHAPWNTGCYRIDKNGISPTDLKTDHAIHCDIATATSFLVGNQRPEFLFQAGRIHGSAEMISHLDVAIPTKPTFFLDFF